MILGALPPVRRKVPIQLRAASPQDLAAFKLFPERTLVAYKSGTQALTAALERCRQRGRLGRRVVLIPAYGCPDLVSACLAIGLTPRLVDVDHDRWAYAEGPLREAVDTSVLAVIAVNFLGLGDDAEAIKTIADAAGAAVIQDSAQNLPRSSSRWVGEEVVLSFGRGKPLNLLGGGLLASLGGGGKEERRKPMRRAELSHALKALGFNMLTDYRLYRLTGVFAKRSVGRTTYRQPVSAVQDPEVMWRFLGSLDEYCSRRSYNSARYERHLSAWKHCGIEPLSGVGDRDPAAEHLRYPILARDIAHRDALVSAMDAAGLGATAMYRLPLNQIDGVPACVRAQGPFPIATALADRLLTLPTHDQVIDRAISEINNVIERVSRSSFP